MDKQHSGEHSRRSFLSRMGSAAVALTAPTALGSTTDIQVEPMGRETLGETSYSANDRIQLALIGAGGMGRADASTATDIPGVQLVGVCDLYDGRLKKAKETFGTDLFATRDYREVLAREEVDAVIVATPDHWHRQISVEAMKAGKDVYCEKPMVHGLEEGPSVVEAQENNDATFQVGSQGMSSLGNEKARELLKKGAIGELNYAEGFWARNSPQGAWQYPIPEDASPETVAWETFLKDNSGRPFDPVRFFRWRNYWDYGTGVAGDLFVHLFSSLHFITGSLGPNRIVSTGGLRFWEDGREVPDVMLGMFDYPDTDAHPPFNLSLRVNFVDGTSGSTFLRLVGSEGAMDVEWDKVTLYKNKKQEPKGPSLGKEGGGATDQRQRAEMMPPPKMVYKAQDDYEGAHYDHHMNFFEGVRGEQTVTEDAGFGYQAAAPALASNISYRDDKIVYWDPETRKVVDA